MTNRGPSSRLVRSVFLMFLVVPTLWTVGRWTEPPIGVDAVSAVTPGHVSVVGARMLPETFDAAAADSLVRRAMYFSGGVHKAFDGDTRWVLIRAAHDVAPAARASHLLILEATLLAIRNAAAEADLALLVGKLDGGDDTWHTQIAQQLQGPRLASIGVELLLVSEEETEAIDVPDSGMAADFYDLPIALLECDAVINIAHAGTPLAALKNLSGLARPTSQTTDADAVLVDQALLAEVSYTLSHLQVPGGQQMILASRDGVAIDRVAAQVTGAASDSASLAALHLAHTRFLGQSDLADMKVSGADVPGTWVAPKEDDPEENETE